MLRRSCRVLEKLVIVESPNKVIKVEGLLSDPNVVGDWSFGKAALQRISTGPEKAVAMATLGHFMALKEITWTPQNTQRQPEDADFPSNGVLGSFSLEWEIMAGRRIQDTVARAIEDKTTNLSEIIIATDPDREGELIAVHALSLIKRMNPNLKVPYSRAYIHSITAEGIQQAMRARSTNFDHNLATAAEARHAMDRIFGFLGSSVVRYANPHMRSIGRVQTPALILIHEREKRIQHVMETTSSTFDVKSMCKFPAAVGNATFTQAVVIRPGSKSAAEKSGEAVRRLAEAWKVEAGTGHRLASAPLRQTQTLPPPEPFTMATLIAKANRQFHLSSEVVSGCLQDLFQMGYITYPRTDSTRIDEVVREAIYKEIEKSFGARMVHRLEDRPAPGEEHNTARRRKTRGATAARKASAEAAAGNVEDAHEAIRPTNITKTSESLGAVSPTMKSIYGLIRKQTLAAFMLPMETERIAATIRFSGANGDALQFQIEGKHALEAGWSAAFRSSAGTGSNNNNASIIPAETELDTAALENGEVVVPSISDEEFRAIAGLATTLAKKGLQLSPAQVVENRPSPPLPYSEGGLIEQLKNHGVGRPSTYPIIVKTLLARNYITVNRGRCETTEVGRLLVRTSSETFPSIVDIGFTASFEKKLDRIAKPSVEANQVLRDHPALTEADYVLSTFVSRLLNYITEATRAQRVKIAERSARLKHDDGDSQELLEDRLTEEKSRSLAQVPDLLDGSKPYRTFTAVQNYLNDYLRRNFPQSPLSGTPLTSIPKRAPWRKKKTYTKRSSWAKK